MIYFRLNTLMCVCVCDWSFIIIDFIHQFSPRKSVEHTSHLCLSLCVRVYLHLRPDKIGRQIKNPFCLSVSNVIISRSNFDYCDASNGMYFSLIPHDATVEFNWNCLSRLSNLIYQR